MGKENNGSLEHTPTWAVSIFALFFFLLSFAIDGGLNCLNKFLRKRKRKSLNRALEKLKTEMMKMGLISLLLTVSEVPISKICVSQTLANSFLPCEDPSESTTTAVSSQYESNSNTTTFFSDATITSENYCESKGMVSLISRDGAFQLNIFVSVLAVSHVLYCLVTMFLGMAKMKKWKAWESETQTLEYQIANDPRRFQYSDQTTFGKRHLKFWSKYPLLLGPVCLVRQFIGSAISKADYFTLRNGFITANFAEGSYFNFQQFLARAYDDDFEQVVGVRFWIWIFCILFIFSSAHVFYNHYWLPFIPLGIALIVGAKLQVIITKMCVETHKENPVIRGSFVVKPNDDLFWFGRPDWLLHLIQFILIQFEYGQKSCFHRATEDLTITLSMGVLVQLLCGYVTLPLYALVTQMGSGMKRAVFTESVAKGLRSWLRNARRNTSKNSSTSSPRRSSFSLHSDTITDISISDERIHKHIRSRSTEITEEETTSTPCELVGTENKLGTSTPKITSSVVEEMNSNPKVVTRGIYDGEISFGSSWKKVELRQDSGEITSIAEEEEASVML
ncbi:MLO-like protein 12 isoform X2 [Humulus lupulus]|uniref:MLO-like protein 12 isoform X2 n=1 Tax=Humulus lupulus TaxID=3486 RepID=UPI002B417A73|nr:MLO-like protein 12 isoform X2 [Humulus lupulus]